MIAIYFARWWYSQGWLGLGRRCAGGMRVILRTFSMPILLRTLFSPWKRVISYGDRGVAERLRSALDNLISRWVGLGVRLAALLAAIVGLVVFGAASVIALVLWPLLPVVSVGLLIRGALPW